MSSVIEGILAPPAAGRRFSVGPSEVLVRVESETTGGQFALIEWTIPPGAPAPPQHVHHDGSETFYVLVGELEFALAGGPVRAPAGSCLHVPAGAVHTLSNPGSTPARALELFLPGRLAGLIEAVGGVFADGLPPDRGRLLRAFEQHDSALVGPTLAR